tara:strand:- start:4607 stop:4843 length:237 start_codon:yes stop_codon:yes gene_type:complete
MKIYGRAQNDDAELNILSEAALVAEPSSLRDLASFLYRCADAIEDQGEDWEHDQFESNDNISFQFDVFNPYLVTDTDD